MASGVPVLMVVEGEPAEIVNSSKCGIVIKPDDINGISNAIKTLIKHKDFKINI